jgi:hypothetical protein
MPRSERDSEDSTGLLKPHHVGRCGELLDGMTGLGARAPLLETPDLCPTFKGAIGEGSGSV